jgi:hypothetical protein
MSALSIHGQSRYSSLPQGYGKLVNLGKPSTAPATVIERKRINGH